MTSIGGIRTISPKAEIRKSSVLFMAHGGSRGHRLPSADGDPLSLAFGATSRLGRSAQWVKGRVRPLKGASGQPEPLVHAHAWRPSQELAGFADIDLQRVGQPACDRALSKIG